VEFVKLEIDRVEETSKRGTVLAVKELEELQLALVGGGMGDVVIA
jgi:hypothetical protein